MAELSGTPTLADMAKETDPNGQPAAIAELLNQTNSMLDDIPWVMSNGADSHTFSSRTSLPTVTTYTVNSGIAPTTATSAQSVVNVGRIGTVSEVAKDVAEFGGNLQANLFNQSKAHIEAMGQRFSELLITGNQLTGDAGEFNGFYQAYNVLGGVQDDNIVDAGGTGSDNTSILLVGWGLDKTFCVFPKGSVVGLEQSDRGLEVVEDTAGVGSTGTRLEAYRSFFYWKAALVIEDWRYTVRIVNIDISALRTKTAAADLFDEMTRSEHRIPTLEVVSPVFYANRDILQALDIQVRDDVQGGGQLGYMDVAGRRVRSFRGIPIRIVDRIGVTEARVV